MVANASTDELVPKVITKFRGISQYRSIAGQPWEWAQDCLNVIVSGAGFLEKLRAGVQKSNQTGVPGNPQIDTMFDFQQAIGTRQLFVNQKTTLGYFTEPVLGQPLVFTLIETFPADTPRFSYVDSNNLLFAANGRRMLKWTGAALQNWGIAPPANPPTIGITIPILTIQRAANVITVTFNPAAIPPGYNVAQLQFDDLAGQVGDMVTIAGVVADATANGNFAIASGGAFTITYASAGANFGPVAQGTITIPDVNVKNNSGSLDFQVSQVSRTAGIVTVVFTNNSRIVAGDQFTMTGWNTSTPAFAYLNGTYIALTGGTAGVTFALQGPDIPLTNITAGFPIVTGGFTNVLSPRTWMYTYGNSVTGEESPASPASTYIPDSAAGLASNIRAYLTAAPSPDPQVDTIFWYANLDGGQDWFLETPVGVPISAGYIYSDGRTDFLLDVTQRANFINYPPPVGNLLSKWQGRIYLVPNFNPQSIVYSGYEKILRGRPESSFPPGNQIQMQVGANVIKGHGPLMNGVVIFDANNKMFMFKGTVEDIVTNQPVNYSEQLEEMPWMMGTLSHQSIQPTPYGLIWWGNDFAIHKWNGIFYGEIIAPVDISTNIRPLIARITPGTGGLIQTAYYNFLERDWFISLICIDGSLTYNRIIFCDVSKEASDNMGIFVSDIQADSIVVREDANGIRHLMISIRGILFEIKAASTATAGIHEAMTSTNGNLNAFWLSGYDGNEDAFMVKMYRWGRLITDQDGFNIIATVVDDVNSTLQNPTLLFPTDNITQQDNKFSVNWKGRRISINIGFPSVDVDASVLQLMMMHLPCSAR